MSAAFLNIAKDLLRRDVATLETVDVWQSRKLLTAGEAEQARAYWHETHPQPEEPTDPDVPGDQEEPVDTGNVTGQ